MAIVERSKCRIAELGTSGLGIFYTDNVEASLPYVLPGEEVSFEKHEYRGQVTYILKEILSPSKRRALPECVYFGACGGCLLQHLNQEDYEEFKLNLLAKALKDAGISAAIDPIILIPKGSRRRAILEAVVKNGEVFLGFRRFQSNQIINIAQCIALMPELSHLLPGLKAILQVILQKKGRAKIFLTKADNGVDLFIETEDQLEYDKKQRDEIVAFAEKNSVVRIVLVAGSKWNILYQREYPYIKFGGVKVAIDAYGFLQASFDADRILSELVLSTLRSEEVMPSSNVADLFSGRGTFSLPISKRYQVDAFELDLQAVRALDLAAKHASKSVSAMVRDLFANPLKWEELNKYEMVVLNPPRGGALKQCINLASSTVKKICYVSCNPETFARDARILIEAGWFLRRIVPVDQFYQTPHLEVVALFSK